MSNTIYNPTRLSGGMDHLDLYVLLLVPRATNQSMDVTLPSAAPLLHVPVEVRGWGVDIGEVRQIDDLLLLCRWIEVKESQRNATRSSSTLTRNKK